jgi:hypothetical protein
VCSRRVEAETRRLETAEYYRQKAAQCRRLAGAMLDQDDPVVAGLLAMAVEFEAQAVALAAGEVTAKQVDLSSQSDGDRFSGDRSAATGNGTG